MRSRASVTLKVLAASFFVYHMAAVMMAGLVPRSSAPSDALLPYFKQYLLATGNDNTWRMFIDRPAYRRYDVVLSVRTADGKALRVGPVLPGLEPHDGSLRSLKVFHSYSSKRYLRFRESYLLRAKHEIERTHRVKVKSVELRYETEKLNQLDEIRRTGVLATKRTWQRGL